MFPQDRLNHAVGGGGGNRTRVGFPEEPQYLAEKPVQTDPYGYVYFIQAEDGGPVKIGWARDPQKRLGTLQTAHHKKLVILATAVDGLDRENEKMVLGGFASARIRGEWFEPTPDLMAYIERQRELRASVLEARALIGRRSSNTSIPENGSLSGVHASSGKDKP